MKSSSGFALIEITVVVVVAAIIGVAAYLYFNPPGQNNQGQTSDSTPAAYQSNQDLDEAANEIEEIDIDAELDASLQELDQAAADF